MYHISPKISILESHSIGKTNRERIIEDGIIVL